jgi:hypothetical protein
MRLKAILKGVAIRMERIETNVPPAPCPGCRDGEATISLEGICVCTICGGSVDPREVYFPPDVLPRAPEVDPLDELAALGGGG